MLRWTGVVAFSAACFAACARFGAEPNPIGPDAGLPDAGLPDAGLPDAGALLNDGWQLALGQRFGCLKNPEGQVKCWGAHSYGELGRPSTRGPGYIAEPLQFGAGRFAKRIAAGNLQGCAILDDDSLRCWGADLGGAQGALGYGSLARERSASEQLSISLGDRAVDVAIAGHRICAVLLSGRLKCWGTNDSGGLGLELPSAPELVLGDDPAEVPSRLPDVKYGTGSIRSVRGSNWNTCVLLTNGGVRCWGEGMLLLGPTEYIGDAPGEMGSALPLMPIPVATVLGVSRRTGCVVGIDGGATTCWGEAEGNPLLGGKGEPHAIAFDASDRVVELAMSNDYGARVACALLEDGRIKCWGDNDHGQLGQGDRVERTIPTVVPIGKRAVHVGVGSTGDHVCALLEDHNVRCWGGNDEGALGLPNGQTGDRGDEPGEIEALGDVPLD